MPRRFRRDKGDKTRLRLPYGRSEFLPLRKKCRYVTPWDTKKTLDNAAAAVYRYVEQLRNYSIDRESYGRRYREKSGRHPEHTGLAA